MFKFLSALLIGVTSFIGSIVGSHNLTSSPSQFQSTTQSSVATSPAQSYTDAQLLAMAGNKYADGNLPLGDNKYVTDGPKKGYIYVCNSQKDSNGGGAGVDGPWIKGSVWNYLNKTSVSGKVTWSNAKFSNTVSGDTRVLSGNDLPLNHPTGIYPIQASDPAYSYDRNPNSISAQTLTDSIPANPVYSDKPFCLSGEVGVMLSGVALFDGFDAEMRDAPAHELQDSCNGHPEKTGEYHYHSLSSCFKDTSEKTVLGYALDGFPITGPMVAANKYLTTDNLDECHGITSEINIDGKPTVTYHYVMTQDFPYSASCFRSKPIQPYRQQSSMMQGQKQMQRPPQEALTACSNKSQGANCSFTSPRGDSITGVCQTTPNNQTACVPNR